MATPADAARSTVAPPPEYRTGRGGTGGRIPPQRIGARTRPREVPLSDRDRELLRHLADGRSTGQIAAALSVSTNTARTRIRRISGKLAVTDRTEVVRAARSLGLV